MLDVKVAYVESLGLAVVICMLIDVLVYKVGDLL